MPISSLLDSLINSSLDRSTAAQPSTNNLRTIERSDADRCGNNADLTTNFSQHEISIEQNKEHTSIEIIDLDKTFLKCVNYQLHDKNSDSKGVDNTESRKNIDKNYTDRIVMINAPNVAFKICNNKEKLLTANQTFDFQQTLSVLCEKLCYGSCNTSTKTCQSTDNMSHLSTELDIVPLKSQNRNDDKFSTKAILVGLSGNRYEF